jgi:hypothetical protein
MGEFVMKTSKSNEITETYTVEFSGDEVEDILLQMAIRQLKITCDDYDVSFRSHSNCVFEAIVTLKKQRTETE